MSLSLKRKEGCEPEQKRIALRRIRHANELLRSEPEGIEGDNIHQIRKEMKHLRALVKLLGDTLEHKHRAHLNECFGDVTLAELTELPSDRNRPEATAGPCARGHEEWRYRYEKVFHGYSATSLEGVCYRRSSSYPCSALRHLPDIRECSNDHHGRV